MNTIKEFVPHVVTTYVDSPIMNQLAYEVDDTRFRRLGFKPAGRLHDGVREVVVYLVRIRALQ